MSDLIDNKTTDELISVLVEEVAKATNELKCANRDVTKAQGRLNFSLVLLNRLMERQNEIKRPS